MRAGDILLFRGNSGIGKIIQWGTKSKYSHIALCVSPKMNLAIEAQGTVRARDIRLIKTPYDIFRIKEEYDYNLDKVISFLVSKLNHKYDYLGVIFLGILKLFRLKKTANKWQKKRDYFCSELIWEAFAYEGLNIVPDKKEGSIVSPGDIAKSPVVVGPIKGKS